MESAAILVNLQGLAICGEPGDAHQAFVVDFEDSLEVRVNSHQLGGQSGVSCNCDAVFASHGQH